MKNFIFLLIIAMIFPTALSASSGFTFAHLERIFGAQTLLEEDSRYCQLTGQLASERVRFAKLELKIAGDVVANFKVSEEEVNKQLRTHPNILAIKTDDKSKVLILNISERVLISYFLLEDKSKIFCVNR